MKTYLVGGAVRDTLMGREPKDKDYVVVGGSVQEMLDADYKQVGAAFPVFLHPETGDEYALARREVKTGEGHKGFEFDVSSEVTLEDDLMRRDLTINSIAMEVAEDGSVSFVDPFDGQGDLHNKLLRHTSEAFSEDPLRVVRLARFYARYFDQGFDVAGETVELCVNLVDSGALNELSHERFYGEMTKAFEDGSPQYFFDFLGAVGAFTKVKFFAEMFYGDRVAQADSNKYEWFGLMAKECAKIETLGQVTRATPMETFVAMVAVDGYDKFETSRSRHLHHALKQVNDSMEDADELVFALRKARVWQDQDHAMNLIELFLALDRATDKATVDQDYEWDRMMTLKVMSAITVGRVFPKALWPELEGAALGKAMHEYRVRMISMVLGYDY